MKAGRHRVWVVGVWVGGVAGVVEVVGGACAPSSFLLLHWRRGMQDSPPTACYAIMVRRVVACV